jgi:endogenous inhibitor of DNA gyrase (YacG/DUF329 family)
MADAPKCPYCRRRPGVPEFTPFCSDRCKMADLGQWLSGNYRVPGAPALDESTDDGETSDSSN